MKAVIYERYGPPDVLELQDIAEPPVKKDEVLVRIRTAGINPADWHFMRGDPYLARLMMGGLRKPRAAMIIGSDMAGQVEAVGSDVGRFSPGDEVFAEVGPAAGHQGSCAEYISLPARELELKPANLSFEEAAAVPMAAMTALIGVREVGNVQSGQKVLINGASGGVGTFAVQIAKAFGAEVTGVCSTKNLEMVQSLGADQVIDYTHEDFTRSGQRYDMLLDLVGNRTLSECRRVLKPKGTFGATGGGGGRWLGPASQQLKANLMSLFVSHRMSGVNDKPNKDLSFLRELIEEGKLKPVLDRTYTLEDTPEAMRHLEAGHARGKVVIAVQG